jgi:6-pyruvoyltetrahydropterin/6-carboxytetrahydropterin synthase
MAGVVEPGGQDLASSVVCDNQPVEIFKEFTLEAAHRLPNVAPDHKCRRLHGHSFRVRLHVRGPLASPTGWVMDFADIDRAFEPYFKQLDHNYLNEVPGLENPTSEALAIWIRDRVKPGLAGLSQVVVLETCDGGAICGVED